MRLIIFVIVSVLVLAGVAVWSFLPQEPDEPATYLGDDNLSESTADTATSSNSTGDIANEDSNLELEVIAENLNIPWEVLFLPDGELLVTERSGHLLLLTSGVEIPVEGVRHVGEGGLLGAALHPDYDENNFIYLYQTTETDAGLINRVVRYQLRGSELEFDQVVVDDLPGARYHDGGRIKFGSDDYLYVTLGDAGNADAAQDTEDLAGSILRYTAEGEIPEDNPFDNAIYSYGHRNPQGLAWDEAGRLWSSEHGRSGLRSGYDEINLISAGNNYGWPEIEGDETQPGADGPKRHSGADTTWAPAGLAYHEGSLYMPGLRGETLYEAVLDGTEIVAWHEHLVGEYGRLRTVTVGPDGLLYVTTSNRDGRGNPVTADDRILRINPNLLGR